MQSRDNPRFTKLLNLLASLVEAGEYEYSGRIISRYHKAITRSEGPLSIEQRRTFYLIAATSMHQRKNTALFNQYRQILMRLCDTPSTLNEAMRKLYKKCHIPRTTGLSLLTLAVRFGPIVYLQEIKEFLPVRYPT